MGFVEALKKVGVASIFGVAGFGAYKALTKVAVDYGVKKLLGPKEGEAPASWQTSLEPWHSVIGGAAIAGLGIFAAAKVAPKFAMPIGIGIGVGLLHSLLVTVLNQAGQAKAAQYLSGYEASAFQLGDSILPHYAPITGGGMSGFGEYFLEPGMSGMGEYFLEPAAAVSGMGQYEANPDIYQAAAGYGAVERNGILPTDDLDRVLDVAEAAAGVGAASYEAAAGFGEYLAEAGPGAIARVPRTDTWVPGTSSAPLWAGERAVNRGQAATASTAAGTLATPGGAGVFG